MRFYFETSALNHLAGDTDQESVIDYLLAGGSVVHISAASIVELVATSDPKKRVRLLNLANRLAAGNRPLAFPSDLLKASLQAYSQREDFMTVSIKPDQNGLWAALTQPECLDEVARCEARDWQVAQEKWYREMHENARPHLQRVIKNLSITDRRRVLRTPATLVRYYYSNVAFLEDAFGGFFAKCGHPDTFKGQAQTLLNELEPWKFFFAAIAYGIFHRAVQEKGFVHKRNTGSVDTQQAIYLAFCDTFVTADSAQHKVMKSLATLGRRRVLSYNELNHMAVQYLIK